MTITIADSLVRPKRAAAAGSGSRGHALRRRFRATAYSRPAASSPCRRRWPAMISRRFRIFPPRFARRRARHSACRRSRSISARPSIETAGDVPDVLMAMNPAALKVNLAALRPGG